MDPYRLPRTVLPSRYDLRLEPDLEGATFAGQVVITVSVREPVAEIVLNTIELDIQKAALHVGGASWPARISLAEDTERCHLAFEQSLPVGDASLHLRFRGTLNDKLRGFYRSRTKDETGREQWLAATQLEATDARRAFPCWDEPAFKSVFATTLVIPHDLQAISNTAVIEEGREGDRKVVRFADTMPMSTYLVAFVVGRLEATEPVMVGKTPLRVWCVAGKGKLAAFGQHIGAFSLGFFEDYYRRAYPSDKLDLIAIPDFAAGAMENLGAITFRETALLVDETTATHAEKERVADVVAHENAHMWFGDLVTMEWWNGLWLNEAFATFMEMLAVDAFKPEWQRWTTFGVSRSAALSVDGLHSTRPIEYPVAAPRDADAMFDVLTYEKGASVLRMLEQYIGPEVFRTGVCAYLDRHAYGNTQTGDLWQALAEASGMPIPEIMDGWVFRPGYPLLSARLENGRELVLRQQRFRYLPDEPGAQERQLPWQVPVQLRLGTAAEAPVQRVLLTEEEMRLALPAGVDAVLLNEGGHGFYRAHYDPPLLAALVGRLEQLAAIERFNLVNDAWAAVQAGLMPLVEYLQLTARFRGERDRNVWSVLLGSLHALGRILEPADRSHLQALVRDRLGPAIAELGWQPGTNESELTQQLRGDLLRAAGTLGNDAAVQARAEELFGASEPGVDASVYAAVVAIVAYNGDAARYADLFQRFRAARTPQEEQRFLMALAAFRPEPLVAQTLTRCLSGEVRTQDAPFLLRALFYNVEARGQAWKFFQDNWEAMQKSYPATAVRRMCEGITALATPAWEEEVRAFFQSRNIQLGGKTLEQYLEHLHVAVRLRQREGAALAAYLRQAGPF